jgi:peptidyl-prolyl cis-trans isomerase A (cyclophilin A)
MFTLSKTLIMKKHLFLYLIIGCVSIAVRIQAQTQVTFYTNMGNFVVEMYETPRPITTKNFLDLVKKKFYDKLIFHRVIKDFVIQGGDPKGDGTGGTGFPIKDELTPLVSNVTGTIAMANSGPNSAESQFYFNLKNNTGLDKAYVAFGKVINNLSVVQAIGLVKTNSNDKPITNVVMDSVRITPFIPTGVNELIQQISEPVIFPNPVNSHSVIALNAETQTTIQLTLFNQQGQLLGNIQKELFPGSNQFYLTDMQSTPLQPGIYSILLTDGKFISSKKFVVIE